MKKDFSGELKHFDGTVITDNVTNADGTITKKPILVKEICRNAVLAADEKRNGEEQLKRYRLARRIDAGGIVEVTAEELVMIKSAVAANYTTIVTGFIHERLEQDPPAEPTEAR